MSITDKYPKEGDIFGIKLGRLVTYQLNNDIGENPLTKTSSDMNSKLEAIALEDIQKTPHANNLLLFQYVGEGICEEFYTSKQFPLDLVSIEDEEWKIKTSFSNWKELWEIYSYCLEHPIIIPFYAPLESCKTSDLLEIDEQFKKEYAKNMDQEQAIATEIENIEKLAKTRLIEKFKESIDIDYQYAYTENAIHDFQKRLVQKQEE